MSDPAVTHRESNAPADRAMAGNVPDGHGGVSLEIRLTATENQILAERAEEVGQSIAGYVRDQAVGDRIPLPPGRGAEIAVLEAQVEELRSKGAQLATHNAELEHRVNTTTTELEALRHADSGECAELRQRIKTLTEHLDSADRHVASMRSRLDQLTVESSRRIARLEGRLREREADFAAEAKRLKDTLSVETGKLLKRVEELEESNHRLAGEAKLATTAAARQRHALESRVSSLLNDIEELKVRDAEAIGDRDRVITSLRLDIENTKSVAAAEKAALRQTIGDMEVAHQRELQQQVKQMDGLKTTVVALERDGQSARDNIDAERRRFEAALADERDRGRYQINARDEQRRKIEARAEAAEKQAAGATAKATMEIARANQLEVRLNAERTARADEIDALTQRIVALAAEREADQNSANLIIDELRLHLSEAIGDTGATSAVAVARERRDAMLGDLQALRTRVAELEATASSASEDAGEDDAVEGVSENVARARIAEVMAYAHTLEEEIAEMRGRLDQPPETAIAAVHNHDETQPSWRRVFGAKAANGRR
jgi:chromosome segregation ATPase